MRDEDFPWPDESTGIPSHPGMALISSSFADRSQLRAWLRANLPERVWKFFEDCEDGRIAEWEFDARLGQLRKALEPWLREHRDEVLQLAQRFASDPNFLDLTVRLVRWMGGVMTTFARENPDGALLFAWLEHLWERFPQHRSAIHGLVCEFDRKLVSNAGRAGGSYWNSARLNADETFDNVIGQLLASYQNLVECRYKPYAQLILDLLAACDFGRPIRGGQLGVLSRAAFERLEKDFPDFLGMIDLNVHRWRNAAAHQGLCPNFDDSTVMLLNVRKDGLTEVVATVTEDDVWARLVLLRRQVGLDSGLETAIRGFVFWTAEPFIDENMFRAHLKPKDPARDGG